LLQGLAPAPLTLPDPLQGAPACARTEPLGGRTTLSGEALVAAGAVANVVEKNRGWLPSPPLRAALPAWLVSGFGRARGSADFARCVFLCPLLSPGIAAAPSSATTSAPPSGTPVRS